MLLRRNYRNLPQVIECAGRAQRRRLISSTGTIPSPTSASATMSITQPTPVAADGLEQPRGIAQQQLQQQQTSPLSSSALMNHPFVAPAAATIGLKRCATASAKKSYTNFQTLVEVLKRRIEPLEAHVDVHSPKHIEEIRQLLSEVQINPKEWEQYTHFVRGRYTRTLVGYDDRFVALLLCWEKGQRSPIHDHAGASCWVKLLTGELQEVLYDRDPSTGALSEVSTSVFSAGTEGNGDDVSYMNDKKGLHAIINPSANEVSVSLHIYAPPFRQCQIFQPMSGEAKTVSMVFAENAPSYQQKHAKPSSSTMTNNTMATTNTTTTGAVAAAEEEDGGHGPLFSPLDHSQGKPTMTTTMTETDTAAAPAAASSSLLPSLTLQDFVQALKQHEQSLSFQALQTKSEAAAKEGEEAEAAAVLVAGGSKGRKMAEKDEDGEKNTQKQSHNKSDDCLMNLAVAGLMERIDLSQDEWNRYCSPSHFSEFSYTRNLVHITDQYSLMVLCWSPEQVLHGSLTLDALADTDDETSKDDDDDDDGGGERSSSLSSPSQLRGTWELNPSSSVLQEDETLSLHQLRNSSTNGEVAVSLHLYSPPLKELSYSCAKTGQHKSRPVVCYNPMSEDGGERKTSSSSCPLENILSHGLEHGTSSSSDDHHHQGGSGVSGGQVDNEKSSSILSSSSSSSHSHSSSSSRGGKGFEQEVKTPLNSSTGNQTNSSSSSSSSSSSRSSSSEQQEENEEGVSSRSSDIRSSNRHENPHSVSPRLRGTVFTNLDAFAKLCDLEFEGAIERHRDKKVNKNENKNETNNNHNHHRSVLDGFGRRSGAGGAEAEEELEEVLRCSRLQARVTEMLKVVCFNPSEWQQCARWDPQHFTRVLLASSPYYSMVLSCWDRGQCSPPHDHAGSRNWVKVLQGNIDEVQYEKGERSGGGGGGESHHHPPQSSSASSSSSSSLSSPLRVSRVGTLSSDSVTFLGPSTIHSCLNDHDSQAFTLHLYSPPYTRTHFYDVGSGERVPIDIPLFGQQEIEK